MVDGFAVVAPREPKRFFTRERTLILVAAAVLIVWGARLILRTPLPCPSLPAE